MQKTSSVKSRKGFLGTYSLGNFRLLGPLHSELELGAGQYRYLVAEGLRRGATPVDLQRLLYQWQRRELLDSHLGSGASSASFGLATTEPDPTTGAALLNEFSARLIASELRSYSRMAASEFEKLPQLHADFLYGASRKLKEQDKQEYAIDYYRQMRAAYYCFGYNAPYDFLKDIQPTYFLTKKFPIKVHKAFADRLAGLSPLLESWEKGLTEKMSDALHTVGGFVPRTIARKQGEKGPPHLSNHSFGMAIDVEEGSNPHIKDHDVFEVLKEVTGYDFHTYFLPRRRNTVETDVDNVMEVHNRARTASDRLRRWLLKYLPAYESSIGRELPPWDPGKPPRPKDSHNLAELTAQPMSPAFDAETSRNVLLIRKLTPFHGAAELEQWSKHGIVTMPLYVAVGMAKLGFSWGTTWSGSKDSMHFELEVTGAKPRDSSPRSVDQLFPPNGGLTFSTKGNKSFLIKRTLSL
jgi:hypothetical protein